MNLVSISNIVIVSIALGAQLILRSKAPGATGQVRPFLVPFRWFTILSIATLFAEQTYYTALQYFTWLQNGLSRLLLPPYQEIHYFLYYSFTEFWANQLIALALGALIAFVIHNQIKRQSAFFYHEEPLLCLLAFVAVGHPFWIAYLALLLTIMIGSSLFSALQKKTSARISLQPLWLPAALLTLALTPLLNKLPFFIYLKI